MAYLLDLRTRFVDAVDRGVGTMSEIAAFFDVNESFIYKLLRQKRERGDTGPLPHGGGSVRVREPRPEPMRRGVDQWKPGG